MPPSGQWEFLCEMNMARTKLAATSLDGHVYVTGTGLHVVSPILNPSQEGIRVIKDHWALAWGLVSIRIVQMN